MSVFAHLMANPVQIRRLTGTDPRGGKQYGAAETIPGRLEWKRRKIIDSKGEESLSEATLLTPIRLNPGDLVTADGREWPVRAVTERQSLYGRTDHWEVML